MKYCVLLVMFPLSRAAGAVSFPATALQLVLVLHNECNQFVTSSFRAMIFIYGSGIAILVFFCSQQVLTAASLLQLEATATANIGSSKCRNW
mmetsp:Transcript_93004/g.189485  ORF Transcript_93004/g.189485 Transcript_93004/m.189485 type:complete len:92 (+) Transcript_93004:18-293(+)